ARMELEDVAEDERQDIVPNVDSEGYVYDDFSPFAPLQFTNLPNVRIIPIKGYNNTVDTFFSSLESQRLEARQNEKHAVAAKKLATARKEHESRIDSLHQQQELHIRKAQAIEANAAKVEEAIAAVNRLVGRGMDWGDIAALIERERKNQNGIAEMIHGVKLA